MNKIKKSSFVVLRRPRLLPKLTPLKGGEWKKIVDFTKIKKGGVKIQKLLTQEKRSKKTYKNL